MIFVVDIQTFSVHKFNVRDVVETQEISHEIDAFIATVASRK